MSALLSILIPTKDREIYLLDLINYILSWRSTDFEIIVQDNGTSDKLSKRIEYIKDSRLKYFRYEGWLSVVDNFDMAIKNSTGKIITMLGDDDSLFEEVNVVAKWMMENKVDAVLPEKGTYVWPDLKSKYNSKFHTGNFRIKNKFTSELLPLDLDKELVNTFNKACTSMGELPRLYYGLIKRETLDAVFAMTGTYFPGPSPDMANAISASFVIKSFYKLDFPLFIAGSCTVSAAGMGVRRLHEGEIRDFKHLPKDCEAEWEIIIPKYWSGPTIWAESAIKAAKKMQRNDYLEKFNVSYFYARSLVFNYRRLSDIFSKFVEQKLWLRLPLITYYYFTIWFERCNSFFPKLIAKFNNNQVMNECLIEEQPTLSQAMKNYVLVMGRSEIYLRLNDKENK
jgi:glycosyltransferase involved in cell wall biosynthesis